MRCSGCPETDPAMFHTGQRYCKACRRAYNALRKEQPPKPRPPKDPAAKRERSKLYMREYRGRMKDEALGSIDSDYNDSGLSDASADLHIHTVSEQERELEAWKERHKQY